MFSFPRLKFKNPPIEWLYDGLAPLQLSDVLSKRCAAAHGVVLALVDRHECQFCRTRIVVRSTAVWHAIV